MDFDKITEELLSESSINQEDEVRFILESSENLEVIDDHSARQALSLTLKARKKKQALQVFKAEALKECNSLKDKISEPIRKLENELAEMEIALIKKLESYYTSTDVTIQVQDGSLKTVGKWDYLIKDFYEVPSEYLKIDTNAVERAIRLGIRKIPGIEIFETNEITIRIKNV